MSRCLSNFHFALSHLSPRYCTTAERSSSPPPGFIARAKARRRGSLCEAFRGITSRKIASLLNVCPTSAVALPLTSAYPVAGVRFISLAWSSRNFTPRPTLLRRSGFVRRHTQAYLEHQRARPEHALTLKFSVAEKSYVPIRTAGTTGAGCCFAAWATPIAIE